MPLADKIRPNNINEVVAILRVEMLKIECFYPFSFLCNLSWISNNHENWVHLVHGNLWLLGQKNDIIYPLDKMQDSCCE